MNRWRRVGEERGSKETDGCPLTLLVKPIPTLPLPTLPLLSTQQVQTLANISALPDGGANKCGPSLSLFTSVSHEKKAGGSSALINYLNETLDGLNTHLLSVSKQNQQLQLPAILTTHLNKG
jgi:hypothetical protein